jgi:hypothetical protein
MNDQDKENIKAFTQIASAQRSAYLAAVGKSRPLRFEVLESKTLYYLTNPHAVVSSLHEDWAHTLYKDGWTYGPALDTVKKNAPFISCVL